MDANVAVATTSGSAATLKQYTCRLHFGALQRCLQEQGERCARKTLELDSDRKAALELGKHVAGLALVECSGTNEEDMVRADVTKFGIHHTALYDGQ